MFLFATNNKKVPTSFTGKIIAMKIIVMFLASAFHALLLFGQTPVLHHNIFFTQGQTELTQKQKEIIEGILQKQHDHRKVMLFPLVNDAMRGEPVFDKHAGTQAEKMAAYLEALGQKPHVQSNFPCNNRGLSFAVSFSKQPPVLTENTPNSGKLKDQFPAKSPTIFIINPLRDTTLLGPEGTHLHVPATCLTGVKGKVAVTLTEYYSMADVLKAGMHTCSNGKFLQTGGTIRLEAHALNNPAQKASINPRKPMEVQFTVGKEDDKMKVFIQDPRRKELNWIEQPQSRTIVTERVEYYDENGRITKEEYEARLARIQQLKALQEEQNAIAEAKNKQAREIEAFNQALEVYNLGLINCDRFPDDPQTEFAAVVSTHAVASYYLVFNEVRGVMEGRQQGKMVHFGSVPNHKNATLLAVYFEGGKAFFGKTNIQTNQVNAVLPALKETSKKAIEEQLAMLN